MNKRLVLACALMLLLPLGHAAEVYKWKDADGRTRYTDIPPPSNIPHETLSGKKSPVPAAPAAPVVPDQAVAAQPAAPGAEPAAATAQPAAGAAVPATPAAPAKAAPPKTAADKEIDAAKKKQEAEKAKKQQEEKQAEQKVREQNCAASRNALNQLEQGGRIYNSDGKGGREYLGDAEIEQKKAEARKKVEEWCGSQ